VEKNVLVFAVLAFFLAFFLQILPQLKTFSKNLNVRIILVLDVTFVPNLTFLGFLSPEILFGEKTVIHPGTFLFHYP